MEQSSFNEVIKFAIRKEADSVILYESMAANAKKDDIRDFFQEIASEERKHKKILEELSRRKIAERRVRNIPDLKMSAYLVGSDYSPDTGYQDALILAMKREEKALAMYDDLSQGTTDPELKKLFQLLAQEEQRHKLRLETEYDEHIMTWN